MNLRKRIKPTDIHVKIKKKLKTIPTQTRHTDCIKHQHTKKIKSNKIIQKRNAKQKRLKSIITTPQKFRVTPPSFHQLWKCIQPKDLEKIIHQYYPIFCQHQFVLLLYDLRHVLSLQPIGDLLMLPSCELHSLSISKETQQLYIARWGKQFATNRSQLLFEFLQQQKISIDSLSLSDTMACYVQSQYKTFQNRQLYRKEAMQSALICYQYHVPLLSHLYISKINKTKITGTNGCTYHLDISHRDDFSFHYRFTQSRWNYESMPVVTIHQCTKTILQCLFFKCCFHSFGFFTTILEFAGCIGILMEPNRHRCSPHVRPTTSNWKLFLSNLRLT